MSSIPFRAGRWLYFKGQTKLRPCVLKDTFTLDGREYPLFLHEAGMTWRSERIVEIPLGLAALAAAGGGDVLEIGNVLGQYLPRRDHTVVDRYELTTGVINEDAETFSGGPYDAIISLSTIEHIGWDETPRDPGKIPRTIDQLRSLLRPGKRMTITIPHRWNRDLDEMLSVGSLPFDSVSYLQRTDFANRRWRQVERPEIERFWFGYPYVGANAVAVATIIG
jgi:hypothetical protein